MDSNEVVEEVATEAASVPAPEAPAEPAPEAPVKEHTVEVDGAPVTFGIITY